MHLVLQVIITVIHRISVYANIKSLIYMLENQKFSFTALPMRHSKATSFADHPGYQVFLSLYKNMAEDKNSNSVHVQISGIKSLNSYRHQ